MSFRFSGEESTTRKERRGEERRGKGQKQRKGSEKGARGDRETQSVHTTIQCSRTQKEAVRRVRKGLVGGTKFSTDDLTICQSQSNILYHAIIGSYLVKDLDHRDEHVELHHGLSPDVVVHPRHLEELQRAESGADGGTAHPVVQQRPVHPRPASPDAPSKTTKQKQRRQ